MLTSKKVSVVMPCYNQGYYLQQSVRSVLASYSGPLEIIIVNDGSTDPRTSQYLEAVEQLNPCIRVISQQNGGLPSARNLGIENSTGEFLQLLDADDLIIPRKIDVQIAHLESTDSVYVSVCDFLFAELDLVSFSRRDDLIAGYSLGLSDFLYKWERGLSIPIHCALFRRSVFDKVRFNTVVLAKEDWIFWTSLVERGFKIAYLPITGAIYRIHQHSMCRASADLGKQWLKAAFEIDQLIGEREPGFLKASIDWFNAFYSNCKMEVDDKGSNFIEQASLPSEYTQSDLWGAAVELLSKQQMQSFQTKTETPLISVIVPIFNHFQYLKKCLSSVLEQGGVPIELICVNDASTDPRVQLFLEEFVKYFEQTIVITHENNLGVSASQNQAVQIAKGDYIGFLDCDDYLAPGALEIIKQKVLDKQEVDYVFTDRIDVDECDREVRHAIYGGYDWLKPSGNIKSDLLDGMVASHLKLIKKRILLEVGGFDLKVTGVQDWDLALKIADKGGVFVYLPESLYRHRIHENSVTYLDTVGQFRKTNIVRRRYQERWYKHQLGEMHPEKLSQVVLAGCQDKRVQGIMILKKGNREQNLPSLKQVWLQGDLCVMDARGGIEAPCVYFLREFNSYFDCIIWDSPETYASLVGYCWHDNLMCRSLDVTGEV